MPDPTLQPAPPLLEFEVPPEDRPRHIAIIMDGNGRWALERGQPRIAGHRAGAEAVDGIVTACGQLGIEVLTLFSFSLENWQRPVEEINALMDLYLEYLVKEQPRLIANNVRFRQLGRREGLPSSVLDKLDETSDVTRHCTGLTLALALNYGSRTEITDACAAIARKVAKGELTPDQVDEDLVSAHLYTSDLPDPDLLIRTAGEMRISNYLLWQISYAELFVTDVHWPDFGPDALLGAVREYAGRNRRYGTLNETNS